MTKLNTGSILRSDRVCVCIETNHVGRVRNIALEGRALLTTFNVTRSNKACEGTACSDIVDDFNVVIGHTCLRVSVGANRDTGLFINGHTSEINFTWQDIADEVARECDVPGLVEADTNGSPTAEGIINDLDVV